MTAEFVETELDVDFKQLCWLSGGDTAFETELLQSFCQDAQVRLQSLNQALQNQDYRRIRDLAHYLKGASGNVGMRTFAAQVEQIEQQARHQAVVDGDRVYNQLHHQLKQLAAYLTQI